MSFFVAVVPSGLEQNSDLKVLLGKMKRTLRERGHDARWAAADLWHVTLLFLGDLSKEELDKAQAALSTWDPPVEVPELQLSGVGAFPEPTSARVLWLGVQRSQALMAFRESLFGHFKESVPVAEGEREFVPHLTLARLRNLQSVGDLIRLGGRKSFGGYRPREVILFQSVLQGNIKKYVPLVRRVL